MKELCELTIEEAIDKISDWQNNRSGGFVTDLCRAISRADSENKRRLWIAFPKIVEAYDLFKFYGEVVFNKSNTITVNKQSYISEHELDMHKLAFKVCLGCCADCDNL